MDHVAISWGSNSFANRFSSFSYVDSYIVSSPRPVWTTQPVERDRSVTGAYGRPGRAGPDTYFPGYIVMGNLRLQLNGYSYLAL